MDREKLDAAIDRAIEKGRLYLQQFPDKEDDEGAFLTGTVFHIAAKRCSALVTNLEGITSLPLPPLICCLAFACELYIKALLLSAGSRHHGHSLYELFEELDETEKSVIHACYLAETGRSIASMKRDINDFANAFVQWRYLFERDGIEISVYRLNAFAVSLYQSGKAIHVEWSSFLASDAEIVAPLPDELRKAVYLGGGKGVLA